MYKRSKLFHTAQIAPEKSAIIAPLPTVYFEADLVRILAVDADDYSKQTRLKIGAVNVGGSPQIAMNELSPGPLSPGIYARDFDNINWSVFSSVGLARELQLSTFNPHDNVVRVFVRLDGWEFSSMDVPHPYSSGEETEEDQKIKERHAKIVENAKIKHDKDSFDFYSRTNGRPTIACEEKVLGPGERTVLRVVPTVSPFFKPQAIKIHGHKNSQEDVPIMFIDAFCGKDIFYNNIRISVLFEEGSRLGEGVLTSVLDDDGMGWTNVSEWPIISTTGLGRELGIVVSNPWMFEVTVGATITGTSLSSDLEDA